MCVYLPHVTLLLCFLQILSSTGAYWLMPQVTALLAGVLELSLHAVAYQRIAEWGWSGIRMTSFGTFNAKVQGQGYIVSQESLFCVYGIISCSRF